MLLIHEDRKKRIIKDKEEIKFSSSSSHHLIILTARAKREKQISLSGNLSDNTKAATNFHSFKDPKDFPSWATEETYRVKWGDMYFYELEK